jgi:hypothetical protein
MRLDLLVANQLVRRVVFSAVLFGDQLFVKVVGLGGLDAQNM